MSKYLNKLKNIRVLVVEDDDFQRLTMTNVIKKIGIEYVEGAKNGHIALHMHQVNAIDILVCDLNMPDIDGLALIRRLGEQHFSGSILLASALDSHLLHCASKMAQDYGLNVIGALKKPFKAVEFVQCLIAHFKPRIKKAARTPSVRLTTELLDAAIFHQHIKPVFQPQVCFKTGKLIGVESLARWEHESFGPISPDVFVGFAEQHELIDELTELIYVQSLKALDNCTEIPSQVNMSLNISPKSLNNDVIQYLLLNLRSKKERNISIELTEQACIDEYKVASEVLTRLRMSGFSLSLDDFGTGNSTIEQINRFPFNELKIDKSFITNIHNDTHALAIVESCINLAKKLGLSTVVEGVENEKQWHILKQLGCDYCQGFFIAEPVKANDLMTTMIGWNKKYANISNTGNRYTADQHHVKMA